MSSFSVATAQTVTLNPTDDAQVYAGNVTNNYGTDTKLQVKKKDGSSLTRNSYLKFNLTGITVAQVGKAKLRLYCNLKAVDSIRDVMGVFSTTNSWTESTITWNNAPAFTGTLTSTVINSKFTYYEWDVTDYIKQSIPSGTSTSLAVSNINASNNLVDFLSKEGANKPELVISAEAVAASAAYYIDATAGDDNNNGTSAATAWKTLTKINASYLSPGAKIYFKSGQTFNGLFNISNSGTAASPVVVDVYGGTAPVTINGQGQPMAVFAYNRSYIELKNIIVTNYRSGTFAATELFCGIMIMNENAGVLNHIYFDKVKVDSVNSSSDEDNGETVYNGGLRFYTTGSAVPSYFNDVLIKNCTFQNLSRTGCNFRSDWELRNVNTTFGQALGDGRTDNWVPNTNVVIRDNVFRKIAGNGLIVRVAFKALIEGNFFDSCGTTISGNAVFNFNTDSCIYQFNEAQNTVYNEGDTDARGIDADFRTKATIIQYNYLHNNGFGGVVATGGDQTTGQIPQRFNVGTVIRYNLLENNDRQGISFSGAIDGLDVYNNTIYADATHTNVIIVRCVIWAVAPKNLRFKNNIFYFLGSNPSYLFESGSTRDFTNNLFYGVHPASEPADTKKIITDPKFALPGYEPDGYKYLSGSSALGTGVLIPNNGGLDYYGLPVSSTTVPNVGMYNGPAVAGSLPITLVNFSAKKSGSKSALTWTTATEINTLRFELERSTNGIVFEKIGSVKAAGNLTMKASYSFDDVHPAKGINYYRLKQIDVDGKFTYSVVRLLSFDNSIKGLVVYPNPADKQIVLAMDDVQGAGVIVNIFDMQGRKVKEQSLSSGSNMDINVSGLVRGIYSVSVNNSLTKETIGTGRFLKQ